MPGKCDSYHSGQLFIVDNHDVAVGEAMKITKQRLQEIIKEELGLNTPSLEEADMRTRAERYGRNEAEIGTLEYLEGAISDAQQNVDINVLRAFLKEALKKIL